MFIAVDQTTWDLVGQIGLWFVALPALVGGLLTYIGYQIAIERRANQQLGGRWGTAAKQKLDGE